MMTATIDLDLAGADELLRALAGAKAALTPGDHDLAAALIELPAPMSRGARPHGPARAHKAQSLRQEEREEKKEAREERSMVLTEMMHQAASLGPLLEKRRKAIEARLAAGMAIRIGYRNERV